MENTSFEKEKARTLTCLSCEHRGMSDGTPHRNCCSLTNEWGSTERGFSCGQFVLLERVRYGAPIDDYPRRDLLSEDYRTVMQWADAGRVIKPGSNGRRMYADGASSQTSVYYLIEDTYDMREAVEQIEAKQRKVPEIKERITLSSEERLLRKSLDLPVTKPLRYMQRVLGGYDEIAVVAYEIVETTPISGTPTLLVTLETGNQIRVFGPYFSEMQKPSFERDMVAATEEE